MTDAIWVWEWDGPPSVDRFRVVLPCRAAFLRVYRDGIVKVYRLLDADVAKLARAGGHVDMETSTGHWWRAVGVERLAEAWTPPQEACDEM